MRFVGFGVFDVERRVCDVEITAEHRLFSAVCRLVTQLFHAYQHGVEETVFLLHFFRIIGISRMHIHANHGNDIALWSLHVRFDPTAGIDVILKSRQSISFVDNRQCRQQTYAGTPLDTANLVHTMQFALIGNTSRR